MSGPPTTTYGTHEHERHDPVATHERYTTTKSVEDGDGSGFRLPAIWVRTLGELTLSYVPDAGVDMIPTRVYPASAEEDWHAHRTHMTEAGHLPMGCGALLVERGGTRLLIDAGHGRISGEDLEHFQHAFGHVRNLPESLATLGVDPAELETVAFTHFHGDHTGWARPDAVEDPRSLFTKARWMVGKGELESVPPGTGPVLAGQDERTVVVADGTEIAGGVRAWSLPGHTPGHTAWILDTGDGREVVAFGDAMHSPVQVQHPDWEVVLDTDRNEAERSRRRLVDYLARDGVYGFGVHFADQQLGTVDGAGRWRPWNDAADAS
ncbi:MBL fold metallo-hydrolase [Streptomyces sp. 4503]|uniref:MBL fold metallo-hydrolase n=1 Tax=Streptomyces niphimycinicus TaxID=2842201 RepID=A0ABS6CSB1_9ACTN|nr:MBL fold metallo-hydrolase [Streptomyces niphimycinicus]MBU3869842.1 MBL fold metallo-hydrolase [Streptomyces niphimycinicus]